MRAHAVGRALASSALCLGVFGGCGDQQTTPGTQTPASGSPTLGRFVVRRQFQRPPSLPNSNNEGIAIAPASECDAGFKRSFWTDDADEGGFSLRTDLIPCATCL